MERSVVHIGIGTNLGDRRAHIDHALRSLDVLTDSRLVKVAGIIETEPVGPVAQGRFLNTVAAIETGLSPATLLGELHRIERQRGRDREHEVRWGPRALDLDILVFGGRVIRQPGLVVPHKHLHERAFVLVPLAEIAPELVVPGTGHTVRRLLDALNGRCRAAETEPHAEGPA